MEPETAGVTWPFNLEIVWHLPAGRVSLTSLKIEAWEEVWPLHHPFRTSRGSRNEAVVAAVAITDEDYLGRGECVPIKRYDQTVASVLAQIKSLRSVESLNRDRLQELLPAGAARNALDCALWDLEAKRSGKRVWELANIQTTRCSRRPMGDARASHSEAATVKTPKTGEIVTSFTISLDTPEQMSDAAAAADTLPILKLKLGGDEPDLARVQAVRAAAPNARLLIDANESWSPQHYQSVVPTLSEIGVELIEQPFPAANDDVLETLDHPIPVCADESCHTTADLARLKNRYEAINVKLDKTGGLTEALLLCERARDNHFKLLIGCMVCTSLSIAPALLLAGNADWADLDGPLLLARDREHGLSYRNGSIGTPARELWG